MKIASFIGMLVEGDGAVRVFLTLAHLAKKNNIENIIISGGMKGDLDIPSPVILVPSVIFPFYKTYRLSSFGLSGFEKQLDEFKPDIIHIHSPDTIAWAALKYAKKNKIPIIATHHTDFMSYLAYYHAGFLKPILWAMIRKLYNQLNLITTPSAVISKGLEDHGIKNVITIPWGVDFKRFDPSFRSDEWRKKILGKQDGTIFFCACRLTWEKDLKILAETYNLLKNSGKDFKMVIAGDGPIKKELELMMPGAIFLGYVGGNDLSRAYASSDILLFPSTTETFGLVTVEAMASGIVPVVADAGGSKSLIIDKENCLLTKPKDAKDLFEKAVYLLDNRAEYEKMKKNGEKFSKDFTWENVFDKLLKIYQAQLKNRN